MKWSKEELQYLKNNYEKNENMSEMTQRLHRTARAIQHKGKRFNLSRPRFKKGFSDAISKKDIDKKYYSKNKQEIYKRKQTRINNFRKELKIMLGGKCSICGYNKCFNALDFHHKNGDKEGVMSKLTKDFSKEKSLKEARKCILLCANCHRELHSMGS